MANRYWVGGSGTWDATDTSHWASGTGGSPGASVPTSADNVFIDANSGTGTITVNTNFTIVGFTWGAMNNMVLDFSVNNNSVTITSNFSGTGTGIRTINMGNATFAVAGNWNMNVTTNLTFNAQQSRIVLNNTANTNVTFNGGGLTYYTVELVRGSSTGANTITGNNTFVNFIDVSSTAAHSITLSGSPITCSFYNFIVRGSAGNLINVSRGVAGTYVWQKLGRGVISNCDYITTQNGMTATPSNTWYIGPNSTAGSATFLASNPTTVQSVLGSIGVG